MMMPISRHVSKLSGYAPAPPTPFDDNGNIDGALFEQFCDRQIHEGATALVVCGTTGEAPTLSAAEHRTLIRIAVGVSRGRIPVIAARRRRRPGAVQAPPLRLRRLRSSAKFVI